MSFRGTRVVHHQCDPCVSEPIPMRKPPTGEPCAGEPHARFGGRGRREPFPTPIGEELNDLFNELWFQDTSMCSQCDYLPIPKVSLYSLVNSLKLGPTISGLTTR